MKANSEPKKKRLRPRQRVKKTYETPKLKKFGSVMELTRGSGAGSADVAGMSVVTG